jgi:purine catabolism regulator
MEGIKVKDVYALLKEDGVKLVAGKNGLNRIVNSISVTEVDNPYRWLIGGEMILTTLFMFKKREDKINFINKLNDSGCACVAIHPGNQLEFLVENYILEIGNKLQFPIFILPQEMPYVRIFNKVYEAILNKKEILLKKSAEITYMMTKTLIADGNIHDIILKLYKILNKSVFFLNNKLEIVEKIENSEESNININDYKNVIFEHDSKLIMKINQNECYDDIKVKEINFGEDKIFKYVIIELRENINNYLAIIEPNMISESEKLLDSTALCNVATAIKLQKLKELAIIETKEKLKYDFFDDLINEAYTSLDIMEKRAATLGLNFMFWNIIFIFDIDDFEQYYKENFHKGEHYFQEIKMKIKDNIIEQLERYRDNIGLFIPKGDGYIMSVGFNENEYKRFNYRKFFKNINSKINHKFENENLDFSITLSVSGPINMIGDITKAYKQALRAKEIGKKLYGKGGTAFYEDLGIYNLISIQGSKEEILVNSGLNKIYDYDKKKRGNLLETLEVFLDTSGSINKTAIKIYAHPNTVKYRLRKIKEIIDEDILGNETKRLYYHVLIKALKVIK